MRRLPFWNPAFTGAMVMATALSGCATDPTEGYSMASTFPKDVQTIAIPILGNDTYTREVEFELTDSLIKEVAARTPYRVVDESKADTVLLGRIRRVELDQLSKSRETGLTEEAIVSVTIDFEWKDMRNGTTLVKREGFAGHALFVPSQPSSESIELGRFAVVQQLARDVVGEMRSPW